MAKLKRPTLARKPAKPLRKPGKARDPFSGGSGKGKFKKGGSFDKLETEREKQELRRNQPFGVQVPVGGELTVYLLDRDEPWARYEHVIGAGPNKRGDTFPCIQDGDEPCPLCQKEGKPGSYVMYLTAVVPKESYTKKGERKPTVRRYQKKLFKITTMMGEKYKRLYAKYGTFRGMVLELHRDGDKSPRTGNDVEFVKMLSESEIKKLAAADGIKGIDRETKQRIIKADLSEPFDYDEIMPRPTAKQLGALAHAPVGDGGSIGGADFDEDEDDDIPF